MKTSRIALGLPFIILAACSSSQGSGIVTEKMHTEPDDAGTPDAAQDSASPDAARKDAAPPTPAPTGECGGELTQTACVTCCSTKHEDGAGVYYVALIDCMCLAANCAKACAPTICDLNSPKNPDAACNACITEKNAACAASTTTACTADPACVAFDACVGGSSCQSKSN